MNLFEKDGKLFIEEDGKIIYSDIYVGVRYGGPKYNTLKTYGNQRFTLTDAVPFSEDGASFGEGAKYYIATAENVRIYAAAYDGEIYIRTEYDNAETKYAEPMYGLGMIALGGVLGERLDRAIYNENKNTNGIRTFEMQSDAGIKIFAEMESVESATHTALIDAAGQAMSLGFVTYREHFSYLTLREDGLVEFGLDFDNRNVPENRTVKSDWIRIAKADSLQSALSEYAYAVRDINNITLSRDSAPTGFCTWYYYLYAISEKSIYENMEVLDKIRDRVPLEVFQIDDGWGSVRYDGNDRFPKGMKAYADYIKEHGMTAGIWTHPFNYGTDEPVVREHPDWFISDGQGNFRLVQGQALIDATNPEAREYIASLYHKITYDWGYRYIKVDHITTFLAGGVFYDKEAGALQNMRAYFKTMREACHPDTYILACTSPIFECAEFFDGVRTSGDIFETWESLHGVFKRNLSRWYINGVLYHTDPDCLMLRTKDEEDDECLRPVSRTAAENRTFATAMYTAGGALMISDKLPLMKEAQINDYAKFFPYKSYSGVPLDLGDAMIPSIFDIGTKDGVSTASFINWGDREKTFSITFSGTFRATEHWDGKDLGTFTDEYTVTLPPHESILVHFERE